MLTFLNTVCYFVYMLAIAIVCTLYLIGIPVVATLWLVIAFKLILTFIVHFAVQARLMVKNGAVVAKRPSDIPNTDLTKLIESQRNHRSNVRELNNLYKAYPH